MTSSPSDSIFPHSGRGGSMPSPKKLRPAAEIMISPTPRVACTITGPIALGMMCLQMIRKSLVPMARADSIYSLLRMERTEERMTRAYMGI